MKNIRGKQEGERSFNCKRRPGNRAPTSARPHEGQGWSRPASRCTLHRPMNHHD